MDSLFWKGYADSLGKWTDYKTQLLLEYRQSVNEGLDIEKYEDFIKSAATLPDGEAKLEASDTVSAIVRSAKLREGYPYYEPDGLEAILAASSPGSFKKRGYDRDAILTHRKNGVYGELAVAAMLSAAAVCDDIGEIIRCGLSFIPKSSRLREDVAFVLNSYDGGLSLEKLLQAVREKYDEDTEYGWCFVDPNLMIVAAALLYGEKDYSKTISAAVNAGYDTDCNGATAGSILGMCIGEAAIPEYWKAPIRGRLKTSIDGYRLVSVGDMADITIRNFPDGR